MRYGTGANAPPKVVVNITLEVEGPEGRVFVDLSEAFTPAPYSLKDVENGKTPGDAAAEMVEALCRSAAHKAEYAIRTGVNGLE